jgi:hypothetical protein
MTMTEAVATIFEVMKERRDDLEGTNYSVKQSSIHSSFGRP